MQTHAAVLTALRAPLVIEPLHVPTLKRGQVLVEMAFSGLCHTQLHEIMGNRGEDKFLPHCLGHEGSGIVREIGADVKRVRVGDAVLLSWIKTDGIDGGGCVYQSTRLGNVNAGPIATFNQHAVTSENRLTVLPPNFPLRDAALFGCALPTGVGVVHNTLQAKSGQTIVVLGCGGIGLCVVLGAVMAGCSRIIAVDKLPSKTAVARQLGATDTYVGDGRDDLLALKEMLGGPADLAVDCTGRPEVMRLALALVKQQGGKAAIIGNAPHGETLVLDPREFNQGKHLLGSWGGDNVPARDFPRYFAYHQNRGFALAPLLEKLYPLSAVNQAVNDLANGSAVRPIIDCQTA